jgi:hypothetical protein
MSTTPEGPAFLGRGWNMPVAARAGAIEDAAYEESVRQAIRIVLGTAQGERPMRPDFGCGIHELVFSVGDSNTAGMVADRVRRALIRWEPRIDVLDVGVAAPSANVLEIRIEYRVRATNTVFNLVYPFYLSQERA